VLVEPEIHTNAGNIGRLCVAACAALHLVEPLGFEITDARLKRAGLDYWQHLEWHRHPSLAQLEASLAAAGAATWYTSGRGRRAYTDVLYQPGDVLVFGKESVGLPQALLEEHAESTIRIPIHPLARSLNVAHAVGIVVFEALRQFQAVGISTF
jgi:tRNA (cytidine/uridine-2'-O-)-methyltransferase